MGGCSTVTSGGTSVSAQGLGHDPAMYLLTYVDPRQERAAVAGDALGVTYRRCTSVLWLAEATGEHKDDLSRRSERGEDSGECPSPTGLDPSTRTSILRKSRHFRAHHTCRNTSHSKMTKLRG